MVCFTASTVKISGPYLFVTNLVAEMYLNSSCALSAVAIICWEVSPFFPIKPLFQELCLFGTKLKGEDVVKRRDHFTVSINTASQYLLLLKSN